MCLCDCLNKEKKSGIQVVHGIKLGCVFYFIMAVVVVIFVQ